jgi:hypothetical protein
MNHDELLKSTLASVNYEPYKNDPWVLETAQRMANRIRDPKRSKATVYADCYNGSMLEYAVFMALGDAGFYVSQAPELDKRYDILLSHGGKSVMIDVKGLFTSTKYVNQSEWELMNAEPETVYVAFDCTGSDMVGRYLGWCSGFDMIPSNWRGGYARVVDLEKKKMFIG